MKLSLENHSGMRITIPIRLPFLFTSHRESLFTSPQSLFRIYRNALFTSPGIRTWVSIVGKLPVGEWQLTLPNSGEVRRRFAQDQITDMVFVVTFTGRTPPWPKI
jgi:hypothetical protein